MAAGTPREPRRCRVLVVDHTKVIWGTERVVLGLAPYLAERGVDMVLGANGDGPFRETWRALGLSDVDLLLPAHAGIRSADGGRPHPADLAREAGAVIRSAGRIARAARDVDVVHSNTLWAHLESGLGARLARTPGVVHLHDLVAEGAGRRLQDTAIRLAGSSVAISAAVAAEVGSRSRARVEVIHNGVDLERFRPGPVDRSVRAELGGTDRAPVVGIIGRVDPEKGIDVLVDAVGRLDGELAGTHLVVVGAPFSGGESAAADLADEAHRRLGDRVRFLPPRADVAPVLRALDVLVNASRAEPFGLTVLEAQATGVPVVATRAGGIPEFVAHGETGILVPPGDAVALAAALSDMLGDPARSAALAARAGSRAEAEYGLDVQADRFATLYHRLAGTTNPVGGRNLVT